MRRNLSEEEGEESWEIGILPIEIPIEIEEGI